MVKLYFDSRERVSGDNETPVFQLRPTLDLKDDHSALLDSVCIPNTFRTISANNNRFFIQEAQVGLVREYRALYIYSFYKQINNSWWMGEPTNSSKRDYVHKI